MNANANALAVVAIIGVLLIGVLALGGVRSSTVSVESGPALTTAPGTSNPVDPGKPDGPRIRGGSQSSGWSVLGLNFGGSTTLSIEVPVSRNCFDAISVGAAWPPEAAACDPALAIEGTVARLEAAARGPSVVVEMPASKDCYAVASGGSPWPTGLPQCSAEEAGATR